MADLRSKISLSEEEGKRAIKEKARQDAYKAYKEYNGKTPNMNLEGALYVQEFCSYYQQLCLNNEKNYTELQEETIGKTR